MFTERIIITIVLSSNTVPVTAGQPMSTERTRNETSERWREETSVESRVRANQVNVKLEPIYICKNCPHMGEPRGGQRAHHNFLLIDFSIQTVHIV